MNERWKPIKGFPGYSVSDAGQVRADKTGRILALYENQFGVVFVGMMRDGEQRFRTVSRLVANAFLPRHTKPFDTPINLDGDRYNNYTANLMWRPRWFAIKYNRQFREPYDWPIPNPIMDVKSGEVSANSFEVAKRYGLLERDVVHSIFERTYVWPTDQLFQMAN